MTKLAGLACLLGIAAVTIQARAEDPIKLDGNTAHYRLTLQIGPAKTMYSEAEAKAKHPTSGEIMLSGKMAVGMSGMGHAMPSMMPMPGMWHVELHVYSRDTGKAVRNARVTITLTGDDKKRRTLPIARMQGVAEGPDDLHDGNNDVMKPGAYAVDVAVNGEGAHFSAMITPGS